jgi:tetratricopeptide (TPR) repeat protein
MTDHINYPPDEILHPSYGKPDYSLIILWLLKNNETCTWSDLIKIIKKSTLSNYLSKLKTKNFIEKAQFNQYCITLKGKEQFHAISKEKSDTNKINIPPKIILTKRIYDDLVLWMVYNNNSCKWADFTGSPLSINQSSLSKTIRRLIENQYIEKIDKVYQITYFGKEEYADVLTKYNLDQQYILEEESRRITKLTKNALAFFAKHHISDNKVKFHFLQNILKLPYDRVEQSLNREDFWKILLFLALNHPTRQATLITTANFALKYNIEQVILDFHILQIVKKKIYPTKFFQLGSDGKSTYFQENEKLEKMLRAVVEEFITEFTYLNNLDTDLHSRTASLTMETAVTAILEEISGSLFHPSLKQPLKLFLPDYITFLAYKFERKNQMGGTFDKLECLIWQDIHLLTSQASSEIKYYIDSETLRMLEPMLTKQLGKSHSEIADLLDKQDYSLLLEKIASSLKKTPNQPILHLLKSLTHCHLLKFEDAVEYLQKHIDPLQIQDTEGLYVPYAFILGFSSFVIGDVTTAADIAKTALGIYPDHSLSNALSGLIYGYNVVYHGEGVPNIADKISQPSHLERAINLESSKVIQARLYLLKSQIFTDLKRNTEALEAIDLSIGLQPTFFPLYTSKIKVLLELNHYEDTVTVLDQLLREFPEQRKNLLLKKASIMKKMHKGTEGFRIIEDLIIEYPDDNDLLLHLAYWQQYFNQKTQALETLASLTERDPDNGIYLDTYGEILMSFEEYAQAIHQFSQSLECQTNSWNIFQTHIKLGICHKELDQHEQAIEHLKIGKALSERDFCPILVKQKWNAIADLYLDEIAQMELL